MPNTCGTLRNGEAVVVVHAVDDNGNGTYDTAGVGAGAGAGDPSVPTEATDPVACGSCARTRPSGLRRP